VIGVNRALCALCLLLALGTALTGCGGSGDGSSGDGGSGTAAEAATTTVDSTENEPDRPKKGAWGAVYGAENDLGINLFDLSGHTLYRFDRDKGSVSTCYGACAKAWPPALTEGKIKAVDVPRKLVGTTKRSDGTIQLTYAGHPLYTHSGEAQGESDGHGVKAFGGEWHALRRSGKDVPS
jgi:predicted lipoprotein with Yx(FWY)xxD motif